METNHHVIGTNRTVWNIFDKTNAQVRKAVIKTIIVSGTFKLNSDRAKFNNHCIQFVSFVIFIREISHFLLDCPV